MRCFQCWWRRMNLHFCKQVYLESEWEPQREEGKSKSRKCQLQCIHKSCAVYGYTMSAAELTTIFTLPMKLSSIKLSPQSWCQWTNYNKKQRNWLIYIKYHMSSSTNTSKRRKEKQSAEHLSSPLSLRLKTLWKIWQACRKSWQWNKM